MNKAAILFTALFLLAIEDDCSAQMTIPELVSGIEERQQSFQNLRFDYDVRYQATMRNGGGGINEVFDTDGRFVSSRDEFKLLGLRRGSAWMRYTRNRSGREFLDRFEGANGKTSASFWRPLNKFEQNQARISRGNGFANPGYFTGQNKFPQFLFMRINGITDWEHEVQLTEEMRNYNLDSYRIDSKLNIDGRDVYQLKSDGISGHPEWTIRYEVEVSGEPEFLVLRFEAIDSDAATKLLYEVKKVAKVGDIPYPAAGFYHHASGGQADLMEYTYEYVVGSAKQMTGAECTSIFPPWPTNTLVVDNVTSKTFFTPRIAITHTTSRRWKLIVYGFLGASFAFAVLSAAWFAWSSRQFQWRLAGFIVAFTLPTILMCWCWDELIASAFSTVSILALAVALVVRTVFGTLIAPTNDQFKSSVGAREWFVLAISPAYLWFLVAHPDLKRMDLIIALTWGLVGIVLFLILFRGCLANKKRYGIIVASVLVVGMAVLARLAHATGQFSDTLTLIVAHSSALICVAVAGISTRACGFRITSAKRLMVTGDKKSCSVAFGLSELFVWVSASAAAVAVLGLLSQAY